MSSFVVTFLLALGFLLGLCAGFVMHRADFCLAGMFRDLFLFKSTLKLRSLLLLVVSTMVLFEMARQLGLLPLYPFPLLGSASLTNLVGGFLFGIGMVLAGGCVVGTLYKLGSGSVLSMVAFAGLLAGSGLYAEIHPRVKSIAAATTVFPGKTTVPQMVGVDPLPLILAIAAIAFFYFQRWRRQGAWERPSYTAGSLQPWRAALILSVISLTSYVAVGMPLGITTSYAKAAGYLESLLFRAHVQELAYFQGVPLNYRHPFTGTLLLGGPAPVLDGIALIQFPVIAGVVLGGALSALLLKELRFQVKLPWRQYLSAAIGGIMMGVAARVAPACNVWHLMGGLPVLAAQSLLFVAGLFPGAWLGTLLLSRVVII